MKGFSVIIPVYNAESTIVHCVESVISQCRDDIDLEICIIDDGSIDNSRVQCEYLAALRPDIIKFISIKNSGVSNARNTGLEMSTKEYITFVDSDDYLLPNYFANFHKQLIKFPNALIYQSFVNDYGKYKSSHIFKDAHYTRKEVIKGIAYLEEQDYLGTIWNKVFKRSIIEKNNIRFDTTYSLGEDKIFTMQYFLHISDLVITSDIGYNYVRTTQDSLTKKSHQVNTLCQFVEEERYLFFSAFRHFSSDNDGKSAKEYTNIVNSRYISFNKYILYMMHRTGAPRADRIKLIKSIRQFSNKNVYFGHLDRHVHYLFRKYYGMDRFLNLLVRIKQFFK